MAGERNGSGEHAHTSWRDLTKALLASVLFLAGTLIAWHLTDVERVKRAQEHQQQRLEETQRVLIEAVEQLKHLAANSNQAYDWRLRIDAKIDALIEAEYGRASRPQPEF